MNIDECYKGKHVFWPGLTWFRGEMQPFVREGIILCVQKSLVKVKCLNGPTLTKQRAKLFSSRAAAESKMIKMLGRKHSHHQ